MLYSLPLSPHVITTHCLYFPPTWTFPTDTLYNLGNMAIGQRVSIYRYKGELSKSKNANWPQILNILNTHRLAKVEKYQTDRVYLLQAKQNGTYEDNTFVLICVSCPKYIILYKIIPKFFKRWNASAFKHFG